MKDFIVRKIKSKRKDKYTYEYTDKRGNKVDESIIKCCLEGLYIPPAHDDVKINLNKKAKVVYVEWQSRKGNVSYYTYNLPYKFRKERKGR